MAVMLVAMNLITINLLTLAGSGFDLVKLQAWLDNASFAVLLLTMLVYWLGAAIPSATGLRSMGTAGMASANLAIATLLAARWLEGGYFPLSNLYESLFFLAWGITAVHLFAEAATRSVWVGCATAPVAMGITAFAALSLPDTMQASEPLVPALKSNWLMMHVSVMLLSYAALLVGSLLAVAFLVLTRGQEIQLHGSSVGTGSFRDRAARIQAGASIESLQVVDASLAGDLAGNLASSLTGRAAQPETSAIGAGEILPSGIAASAIAPSAVATIDRPQTSPKQAPPLSPQRLTLADTLDNISYRMIGLGFPLLTIGIISGGVWANEAWGSYWSWDPKETWALIVWLVFAAYLHARITKGWQGRKPALLATAGFVVVWVCYLGVNLLGKGLHSYGWFF